MRTLRMLAVLLGSLAIAGLGAIYVWSTLNELLRGQTGWPQGIAALVVLVGVAGLLLWLMRYVSHLEEPK